MTETTPGVPLGAWLAELDDERLIRLLELRPDLTQPPPGTIAALAARAQARQSVKAATDELDFLRLAVLDALLVLHADTAAVPLTKLLALIGDRAGEDAVTAAVDDLRERALVWGDATVRVAAEAAAGLPWYPGQATVEDTEQTDIAARLEALDAAQRELLQKLLEGSPMGRTRDAAPGTPPDRPVQRLLAAGLLRQVDAETVILPRLVGQVMRGELPGPAQLTQPDPAVSTTTVADVDAVAAGAVIDLLREVELVLETLGATPVPELRSGGLGVRDVKRLTKVTGIDEARLGLILEVSAAAGLIAAGHARTRPASTASARTGHRRWPPTGSSNRPTASKWHLLASTWLDLPGRPSLIGSRGPDGKPYAALSDSLFSTAAPLDRRLLLDVLADLPAGAGVDATAASRAMIWRRPRWAVRLQPDPVGDLLTEAHALGVVGRGAIASPARKMLASEAAGRGRRRDGQGAARAHRPLPAAGRPDGHRARTAATRSCRATGRRGDRGIRGRGDGVPHQRGLDPARPRHRAHRKRAARAVHPALENACAAGSDISDRRRRAPARAAAGRHGSVVRPMRGRGAAGAGRRGARRRTAGDAAARTDGRGIAGADLRSARRAARRRFRACGRGLHRHDRRHPRPRRPGARAAAPPRLPSDAVANQPDAWRDRRGAAQGGDHTVLGMRLDPTVAISQLQEAAHLQSSVVIGYVDPAGVATQRVVAPINVRGGQLTAYDPASGRVREFAIHRVTSVVSADAG